MQTDKEILNKLLNTMDADATRKLVLKLLEENLSSGKGDGNSGNTLGSGSGSKTRQLADPGLAPRPFRTFTMKIPVEWHDKIEKYVKTSESKYSKMSDLVREAIRQFIEEYNI